LAHEFTLRGIAFQRQYPLPVVYKGIRLDYGYRLDFVIEGTLILEAKAAEQLSPVHEAQLLTYLRLAQLPIGLLVNFHAATVRRGLRRLTLK
jgi:GxxExxY protein